AIEELLHAGSGQVPQHARIGPAGKDRHAVGDHRVPAPPGARGLDALLRGGVRDGPAGHVSQYTTTNLGGTSIRPADGERPIDREEIWMVTDRHRPGEASFEEFVHGRAAAFARIAYLLTGDRHDAEDLVQTALARAAVRWDRITDPEAYVRRVLYTQAVSWWRVLRRRRGEVLTGTPPEAGGAGEADPELRVVLTQALAKLTAKQRTMLVLRFYEDRTEAETA